MLLGRWRGEEVGQPPLGRAVLGIPGKELVNFDLFSQNPDLESGNLLLRIIMKKVPESLLEAFAVKYQSASSFLNIPKSPQKNAPCASAFVHSKFSSAKITYASVLTFDSKSSSLKTSAILIPVLEAFVL